jgi:hypothetical protein
MAEDRVAVGKIASWIPPKRAKAGACRSPIIAEIAYIGGKSHHGHGKAKQLNSAEVRNLIIWLLNDQFSSSPPLLLSLAFLKGLLCHASDGSNRQTGIQQQLWILLVQRHPTN